MFQNMVARHVFPQVQVSHIDATTSAAGGTIVPFNVFTGLKSVTNTDATYLTSAQVTGAAAVSGFYFARLFELVSGYSEMVAICSVSLQLGGLPPDAVAMGFATSADLSGGPPISSGSVPALWYPFPVNFSGQSLSFDASFPVQNASNLASYFGVAIFGTFGTTPKSLNGGFSIRQHLKDVPIYTPVK